MGMTVEGGLVKSRRFVVVVFVIDLGALFEQQLKRRRLSVESSVVKRRAAIGIDSINASAVFEQQIEHFGMSVEGRMVHGHRSVGICIMNCFRMVAKKRSQFCHVSSK